MNGLTNIRMGECISMFKTGDNDLINSMIIIKIDSDDTETVRRVFKKVTINFIRSVNEDCGFPKFMTIIRKRDGDIIVGSSGMIDI